VASWLFAPLACASGIAWSEAQRVGALLGTKTVLNQLLAFGELAAMPGDALSERTHVITTYALCGFANFGSVGIPVADWRRWCRSVAARSRVWGAQSDQRYPRNVHDRRNGRLPDLMSPL